MAARRETSLGGGGRGFPSTHWSLIVGAKNRDSGECRRALDELCRLYWKPIYAYVRIARSLTNEEAKDLAQEFILHMIEGEMLQRFAPEKGSFRGYLRGALRIFLMKQHHKKIALKRGGGRAVLALDHSETRGVEDQIMAGEATPEDAFEQQWANSVIDLAVAELKTEMIREGKEIHFSLFDRHELHPPATGTPSHADLAAEFRLRESDVNHALAACRRSLREHVRNQIRKYVSSEEELSDEIRRFFTV